MFVGRSVQFLTSRCEVRPFNPQHLLHLPLCFLFKVQLALDKVAVLVVQEEQLLAHRAVRPRPLLEAALRDLSVSLTVQQPQLTQQQQQQQRQQQQQQGDAAQLSPGG